MEVKGIMEWIISWLIKLWIWVPFAIFPILIILVTIKDIIKKQKKKEGKDDSSER